MTTKFPIFLLALSCWLTFAAVSAYAASPVSFAGGDGSSFDQAIVIKGGNEKTGVRAEYDYLRRRYPGCRIGGQALINKKRHAYDVLDFATATGEKKKAYFDITGFFGKLD